MCRRWLRFGVELQRSRRDWRRPEQNPIEALRGKKANTVAHAGALLQLSAGLLCWVGGPESRAFGGRCVAGSEGVGNQ